jgi:hypothetical protein
MYVPAFPERIDRNKLAALANANTIRDWVDCHIGRAPELVNGEAARKHLGGYTNVQVGKLATYQHWHTSGLKRAIWVIVDPCTETLDQVQTTLAMLMLQYAEKADIHVWIVSPNR